jgi:hypothetical protein
MKGSRGERTKPERAGTRRRTRAREKVVPMSGEIASMGCSGLFFDANLAVFPPTVKLAMHLAFTFFATCLAASMIADAEVPSVIFGLLARRYTE